MDSFSERCGLSKSYISLLERNNNPSTGKPISPTVYALKRIAEATQIDFESLINLLDDSNATFNFDIQKINLSYIFMLAVEFHGSIINFFEVYFDKLNTNNKQRYGPLFRSKEELIHRFQYLYNKNDLITHDEQRDFNNIVDFDCPDLNDSSPRFKLNDIISFIQDPYSNWLIGNIDNTVRMVDSCISAYRDLHLYRIIDKDNVEYVNKAINDLNKLMHDKEKEFITNYNTELNNFLSVKYTPVNNYYNSNSDTKMNELIIKLDKFFELFSELDRNGIFEDLNKLNPDDRTMVYSLIKRLEEKNEDSNGV